METDITIHTPQDSAIAAYGVAESRHPLKLLIGGGLFAFCLIFVTLFCWLLSRPLPIPEDTSFLFVVRPKTVQRVLSVESRAALPEPWKASLESPSSWPIVFGAHQEEGKWNFFTLTPRWHSAAAGYSRRSSGLAAVNAIDHPSSTRTVSYGNFVWSWFSRFRSYAIGELHLRALSPEAEGQSSSTVRFALYRDRVQTDLAFAHNSVTSPALIPVSSYDVSLDIQRLSAPSVTDSLFHAIRWGDAELSQLSTPPIQAHLAFDEEKNVKQTELLFQEPLTFAQKQELLAHMRVVEKKLVRLPDGSYSSERRFPTVNEHSSTTFTSILGQALLQERSAEARYGSSSTTEVVGQPVSVCAREGVLIARLSNRSLTGLLSLLSINLPPELTQTGIQFVQQDNFLILCREP